MKSRNYLLLYCLLISTILNAHTGGHFRKGEQSVLNIWRLRSGGVIQGNFSFSKGNTIFLEQEDGIIKQISIDELSVQDQKLARLKINKYLSINKINIIDGINDGPNFSNFIPIIIFIITIILLLFLKKNIFRRYVFNSTKGRIIAGFLFLFSVLVACSKHSIISTTNNLITNPSEALIPKTNISFIDSAFMVFKPTISTSWDSTYFYISSTGIPNHNMMIGITSWQQQVPISQPYNGSNSWSIPLQPVYSSIPLSTKSNLMKGAVAVAVNGIPIFNALNNRGEDSYKIGELDNWGGHCGRGDDYHYHAAPLHLSTLNGLKPIAFAVDGFPVYGLKEPDGTSMNILDTCHGHIGSNGIYHYHGTTDYPYVIGALKGKVTLDPSTTAPENQVIPQAFTKPVRPATSPLNGAVITDFTPLGSNGYLLTYKIATKNGYVKYSWDLNNKFTFILTDTAGNTVTNIYQR